MCSEHFWLKTEVFSTFWCFSTKQAAAECDSRAVTMVDGPGEFETVEDNVGNEKTVEICENSPVAAITSPGFVS